MSKFISAFAIFLFAIVLISCTKNTEPTLIGKWQPLKAIVNGTVVYFNDTTQANNLETEAYMQFADNKKVGYSDDGIDFDFSDEATYTFENNVLTIIEDGESQVFEIVSLTKSELYIKNIQPGLVLYILLVRY